jgi:phosphonate transport system permease protein
MMHEHRATPPIAAETGGGAAVRVTLPPPDLKRSLAYFAGWAVLFAALAWSWKGADMRPLSLIEYSGNMVEFSRGFFPPDFKEWRFYLDEMVITVQVAVWGTVLSVVAAIPLGILCAENVVPWWIYQPVRRLMDAARAINEMVFAMLFVVAVGLGPFAGVLALFVHTTGVLAKLFSEAVEAIDPRPVEGIRSTGAGPLQEVVFGIIPQVMPLWISYSLYRFESNVRSATVLGIVGAGGIGAVLWEYIRGFYYGETAAVMLIIIASVTLLDLASQRLRRWLV